MIDKIVKHGQLKLPLRLRPVCDGGVSGLASGNFQYCHDIK